MLWDVSIEIERQENLPLRPVAKSSLYQNLAIAKLYFSLRRNILPTEPRGTGQ